MKNFNTLCMNIHFAIHAEKKSIVINNEVHPIVNGKNGCKYIKYEKKIFIQQDKNQKNILANRSRHERITRIVRSGAPWGYITDDEVVDPIGE